MKRVPTRFVAENMGADRRPGGSLRLASGTSNTTLGGYVKSLRAAGIAAAIATVAATCAALAWADNNIHCQPGARACDGTDQRDTITGTRGSDSINAKDRRDIVRARAGLDSVVGGGGNDRIELGKGGSASRDFEYAWGARGNDLVIGGPGDDALIGEGGRDVLKGGPGDDVIWADDDGAADTVYCGLGNDTVRLDSNDTAASGCEHFE